MSGRNSSRSDRVNLLIVRAGDTSLHPRWIESHPQRNWDILVNYYGDNPKRYRGPDILRIDSKGPKWPALKELIDQYSDLIMKYQYIFFPDDDLLFEPDDIDLLFNSCHRYQLSLAQPSLSATSFVSHNITIHNPQAFLRFTNWVEIMAPCFARDALKLCSSTFNENLSGWGLCILWPTLLGVDHDRIGIVDAVQAKHTRQFFGSNYEHLTRTGVNPMDEIRAVLTKYDLTGPYVRNLGAICSNGIKLSLDDLLRDPDIWQVSPW